MRIRIKKILFYLKLLSHDYYRDQMLGGNFFNIKSDKSLFFKKNLDKIILKLSDKISFFYFSGGTTGQPKTIPLSNKELKERSQYRSECYKRIGINKKNKVAVLLPFGPWVAGPSAHSAAKEVGCVVFSFGLLKDEHEIVSLFSIIKKHKIDTLITAPSFIDTMLFFLKKNHINDMKINTIITSGEFITDSIRQDVKNHISADIYSTYASSEAFIGHECVEHSGYHFNPNRVGIKVQDDKILISVYDSEIIPILNYEIGDLGYIDSSRCSCGSALPRVHLSGRGKNVFSLSGAVKVYPYQVVELIRRIGMPIRKCIIIIDEFSPGKDFIKFIFGLSNMPKDIDRKFILDKTKNLSLDFADAYNQDLIKIELDFMKTFYKGNKLKIEVQDNRTYER